MAITKDELLQAPADEYMSEAQLEFFRRLLEDLRQETMDNIEAEKQQLAVMEHAASQSGVTPDTSKNNLTKGTSQ